MNLLQQSKRLLLGAADSLGCNALLLRSPWRSARLLVLCYHGTSIHDEHLWDPFMFITPEWLRRRMELLRQSRCQVLPLGEALGRLHNGTLPPRAVAITYDDGTHDFYSRAFPVLRSFSVPVTVYLTTYYCAYNRPVFDVMCDYLLWKSPLSVFEWPKVLPSPLPLQQSREFRAPAARAVRGFSNRNHLTGQQKDELLTEMASNLQVNYSDILANRILHIMTPDEVRDVASRGVDIQLHTHRHRVSLSRERFLGEMSDNRNQIISLGVAAPSHFCYPGGFFLPEFPQWLRDFGVLSATTCNAGIANRQSDPYFLPRLVDHMHLPDAEFKSWLSGLAQVLPRRPAPPAEDQLAEDQAK